MKLTKEEIQFIDYYLKNSGIKYWDVRLEMVDHIASKIESFKGSVDFDTAFEDSLKQLNLDKNLDIINTQSWKTTNKIYRVKLYKEILNILKQPLWLAGFLLFYLVSIWLRKFDPEILLFIYFGVIVLPLVIVMVNSVQIWRNDIRFTYPTNP